MENLGSADLIHSKDRWARIKCFGRRQRAIHLGDRVVLHRGILYTSPELVEELVWTGQLPSDDGDVVTAGLPSPLTNFDVATTLGFIHVRGGTFISWDDHREIKHPLFDYQGRAEGDPGWWPAHAFDSGTCDDCRGR